MKTVSSDQCQLARGRNLAELTPREREVLALIAQRLTDLGIGKTLWLTRKTIAQQARAIHDGQHYRRVLACHDLSTHTGPRTRLPRCCVASRAGAVRRASGGSSQCGVEGSGAPTSIDLSRTM